MGPDFGVCLPAGSASRQKSEEHNPLLLNTHFRGFEPKIRNFNRIVFVLTQSVCIPGLGNPCFQCGVPEITAGCSPWDKSHVQQRVMSKVRFLGGEMSPRRDKELAVLFQERRLGVDSLLFSKPEAQDGLHRLV